MAILQILSLLGGLMVDTLENEKPFVVVELFTSEGCSSCPPADELLSEIVDGRYENTDVIGLSFHVDYWDYIGWKDPYASRDFTNRQRIYAEKLRSHQLYTPQMVVNGKHEFVGSNRQQWLKVYEIEAVSRSGLKMQVGEVVLSNSEVMFSVAVSPKEDVLINLALVERDLDQNVTRGENRGRKLSHDNVVRSYDVRRISGGQFNFELPVKPSMDLSKSSLVVYAQDPETYQILSAEKIDLK